MTALFLTSTLASAAAADGGGFSPFQFVGGAAFWTILIFVLALPVMWKFVFGPITAALDTRDSRLEEAIQAAERTRKEAEEQTAIVKQELEAARVEARKTVEEATARAERAGQEQIAQARAESEREKQRALSEMESLKSKALQEIRAEVVNLTINSASKILDRNIDDAANRDLVTSFLGKAEGSAKV